MGQGSPEKGCFFRDCQEVLGRLAVDFVLFGFVAC